MFAQFIIFKRVKCARGKKLDDEGAVSSDNKPKQLLALVEEGNGDLSCFKEKGRTRRDGEGGTGTSLQGKARAKRPRN